MFSTHTLKHLRRETAGLKSFDGHKIKCQRMVPLMTKRTRGKLNLLQLLCQNTNSLQVLPYTFYSISCENSSNHHENVNHLFLDYSHHHYRPAGGAPLIYFHHGSALGFSPVTAAGAIVAIVLTVLSMLGVAGVCWLLVRYRRKLSQ